MPVRYLTPLLQQKVYPKSFPIRCPFEGNWIGLDRVPVEINTRNREMDETLTVSKALLVRLLDAALPRDDDPGPWGPIGPVIRWRDWSWLMLNPQPLPPDPPPDLPRVAGPFPDPWHAAALARRVIDRLVTEAQLAEVVAGSSGQTEAVRAHMFEFVDDYCGNRPPRWPRPWPWPPTRNAGDVRGLDLLIAGAQFQKAANAMNDNPLQADFSAAADRFFSVGLERMQAELQ